MPFKISAEEDKSWNDRSQMFLKAQIKQRVDS